MNDLKLRCVVKEGKIIFNEIQSIDFKEKEVMVLIGEGKDFEHKALLSFDEIELIRYAHKIDINKNEVFEGDIVKVYDYDKQEFYYGSITRSNRGVFKIQYLRGDMTPYCGDLYCCEVEIVGNIFQNSIDEIINK